MRRKSASGPDRIRIRCVSCRFPSFASWYHVCYYRPKDTTFYWCCGRARLECDPRGAIPSDALSYQTNRTGQTGRTARMTLGVYLGEILPRMPIPQGGVPVWGSAGGERRILLPVLDFSKPDISVD